MELPTMRRIVIKIPVVVTATTTFCHTSRGGLAVMVATTVGVSSELGCSVLRERCDGDGERCDGDGERCDGDGDIDGDVTVA